MTLPSWNFPDEKPPLASISVDGVEVKLGDRVRIWPVGRADIFDLALEGKIGVVEAIEHDFDDKIHFALVLEHDPGRDLGMMRQPGHRFFFSPQEIMPVDAEGRPRRSP